MNKKWLIYIGGALVGAGLLRYAYKNYVLATEWDYEVSGLQVKKLLPPEISFTFILINKSTISAKLKSMDIRVFSSGVEIAKIYQPEVIEVAGNGKTAITVNVKLVDENIKKDFLKIAGVALQSKDIPLDFVGNMRLLTPFGWAKIPVKYSTTGKELYELYQTYY